MVDWMPENPAAGDFSGLESAAVVLQTCIDRGVAVADGVGSSRDVIRQAWPDENGQLWAQSATGVVDQASQVAAVCSGLPDAIRTFLDAVGVIDYRYRGFRDDIEDAVAAATVHGIRCRLVGGGAPGLFAPPGPFGSSGSVWGPVDPVFGFGRPVCEYIDPADGFRPASFAVTPESTEAVIGEALAGIGGLYRDRDEADQVLSDALTGAIPPGWAAQKAVFAGIGAITPGEMTPVAYGQARAVWVKTAAADGRLSEEEVAELGEFFNDYGLDRAVMSMFFRSLGGTATVDLVNAIGQSNNTQAALLALAQGVREGLATASQEWTRGTAVEFVDGLFDIRANSQKVGAIGFLFAGPPYLGPQVALRAGELADARERGTGGRFEWPPDQRNVLDGPLVWDQDRGGGWGLLRHDAGDRGVVVTRDMSHYVFDTLSQYPVQTTAFFLDPEVGVNRRVWWFKTHDWSDSGFQTPTGMLAATQQIPGGPASPPDQRVPAALKDAARVFSWLAQDLTANPTFATGHENDQATANLALALALNHPALVNVYQDANVDRTLEEDHFRTAEYPGDDGGKPIIAPLVRKADLQELYGVAGSGASGSIILGVAMDGYRDRVTEYGADGSVPDTQRALIVGDRVVASQELFDRSVNKHALNDAARLDAAATQTITAMVNTLVIASAPVALPGSLAAAGAIGTAGAVTSGSLGAARWLTERYVNNLDTTQHLLEATEDQRTNYTRMQLAVAVAEVMGVDLPPVPDPTLCAADPDWYQDAVDEWVKDNYDTVDQALADAELDVGLGLDFMLGDYDANPNH